MPVRPSAKLGMIAAEQAISKPFNPALLQHTVCNIIFTVFKPAAPKLSRLPENANPAAIRHLTAYSTPFTLPTHEYAKLLFRPVLLVPPSRAVSFAVRLICATPAERKATARKPRAVFYLPRQGRSPTESFHEPPSRTGTQNVCPSPPTPPAPRPASYRAVTLVFGRGRQSASCRLAGRYAAAARFHAVRSPVAANPLPACLIAAERHNFGNTVWKCLPKKPIGLPPVFWCWACACFI